MKNDQTSRNGLKYGKPLPPITIVRQIDFAAALAISGFGAAVWQAGTPEEGFAFVESPEFWTTVRDIESGKIEFDAELLAKKIKYLKAFAKESAEYNAQDEAENSSQL